MKITIEIPEEYEIDFNDNKFSDALSRFIADVDYEGLAGKYEIETAQMLIESFKNAVIDGEYEWEYPYNDIVIGGKRIGKRDKRCPKCKSNFSNNLPWNARYCPNCGAKMKGDVKNEI